jgi:hypothetical protein
MKFQTCFTPQKGIINGMLLNEYNEGYLYLIMSCVWRREGWGATRSILYIWSCYYTHRDVSSR